MRRVNFSKKPKGREVELDFIRGIAILLVLDFHSPKQLLLLPFTLLGFNRFGFVGVDVFFVLSGFLVGGLLIKELMLRSHINSGRFIIRRGLKIWPQYYVFVLLAVITGRHQLEKVWGNFLNIQNYVGGIPVTWSLAVEEHAYLLLVAVLAIAAANRVRMVVLFPGILATAVAVGVWRTVLQLHDVGNLYWRTDTRIDGILYGLLLAMLYHYWPQRFRQLQQMKWLWWSCIILYLAYVRFRPSTSWGVAIYYVVNDMLAIALLLLLYHRREGKPRPFLYRLVAWIGLYSYGIYLWHVAPIGKVEALAKHVPAWLGTILMMIVAPLAGIALGVIATKLVEFPMLALRDRLFPRTVDSPAGTPAEIELETGLESAPESVSGS